MPKLSVIVCAHNPRPDFLSRTLAALSAQTLPVSEWEFLVVDNLSSAPLSASVDLAWHPRASHINATTPGLTAARIKGISHAAAPVMVFVDDDNELDRDYLRNALEIIETNPRLGCIGAGSIRPDFETEPAPELRPYLCYLALREVPDIRWSNQPSDGITPWGAGLVVRADVAQAFAAEVRSSPLRAKLGRSGESLLSGEDDEFTWIACSLGYGKGLFPALALTHLISAKRTEKHYLLRLAEGVSASHAILAHLHGQPAEEDVPPSFAAALSAMLRGRICSALSEANRALIWRRTSPIERAFVAATRRGRERARQLISEVS